MKLTDLLKEVRINKPQSKKDILQYIVNSDAWYLTEMLNYASLEVFTNIFDYEDIQSEEDKRIMELYFQVFKPLEIVKLGIPEDGMMEYEFKTNYKYLLYLTSDENEESFLIFHNIPGIEL